MKSLASLRGDLQEILAGKEYQAYYQNKQNFLLNLFNRLKNWLYALFKRLFPHSDIAHRASEWVAYGITAVGVLLIALMLYLLLSRFVRQGRIQPKGLSMAQGLKLTVQHHMDEAQSLADKGDYGAALRHLFLGFILYLDQNRWIEAKAWKTNWEYFTELRDRAPQLVNSFTSLAVKFEETMYGGRPISQDDYWLCCNQVSRCIQEGKAT